MQAKILSLDNQPVGDITLNADIFALKPRVDIIKSVIDWQRAKMMAGTHQTKTISQISGTTKKPFKQKGTGNARQGSLRSAQMRGGAKAHGPIVRSHATKLPKKVRKLGLKLALSAKLSAGKLLIVDQLTLAQPKTKVLKGMLAKFNASSLFIVAGNQLEPNFSLAVKNMPNTKLVAQIGANVYDIIRCDLLLLSKEAVSSLEERLK